jgi:hypothetical protein
MTRDSVLVFAASIPLLVAGILLGGRRFLAATPQDFRRMTIRLLAMLAGLGILKSVI